MNFILAIVMYLFVNPVTEALPGGHSIQNGALRSVAYVSDLVGNDKVRKVSLTFCWMNNGCKDTWYAADDADMAMGLLRPRN